MSVVGRQPVPHGRRRPRASALPSSTLFAHDRADGVAAALEDVLRHIEQARLVSCGHRGMRDAMPHRPRAEHGDPADHTPAPLACVEASTTSSRIAIARSISSVGVVEVRRHADAGARAIVDDDVAADQLLSTRPRRSARRRSTAPPRSRSSSGVFRRAARRERARRSAAASSRSDCSRIAVDADLADDLVAGARRIERRNVRRAALKTLGAVGVPHGAGRERERRRRGRPSRSAPGSSVAREIRPHVEIPGAGRRTAT